MTGTAGADRVTLAIDLGGTNLRMALVKHDGTIVVRRRFPTCSTGGRGGFVDAFRPTLHELLTESRQTGISVAAVGTGVPGLVDRNGRLCEAVNLPFLDDTNINDLLNELTGLPAVTANDADAAAVGEQRYGAGRGIASLLLFTLGTGVGTGLLLNNQLWTGSKGFASEGGHITVEPDGIPCPCGNRGCLEQYASATALLAEARRRLDGGADSSLAAIDRGRLTAAAVGAAARDGDPLARDLLARAGRYLGQAAATAANLLNLDAFILSGGMAESFPFLAPAMTDELKARAFPAMTESVRILQSALGDDAGLLGMAALAWELAGQCRTTTSSAS